MPYIPYWFESLTPCFPWVVPCLALASLWLSKSSDNRSVQRFGERIYFGAMLLVAGVALRTILVNEGCWLLHMGSIGFMVLGATFPHCEEFTVDTDVVFND